ncbi:MAG: hypothetical protein K6T65_06950 [Peptococcaceae bacterium]|nr:hypothetical protein [Peptococcaceae bacterium]
MNAVLTWGKNVSSFSSVQKKFDASVSSLLNTHFRNASDYQKEKFVKSCVDQIAPLEKLLLYQEGLHPAQLRGTLPDIEKAGRALKSIEKSMISAVDRMYRHANIFLAGRRTSALDRLHAEI